MTKTPDEYVPHIEAAPNEAELQAFAADPTKWGKPKRVLTGTAAAAHGRAVLEAAGVDLDALEERRRGRPRLGGGETGTRSPRVNASIPVEMDLQLRAVEASTGKDRSELVREALRRYLPTAS